MHRIFINLLLTTLLLTACDRGSDLPPDHPPVTPPARADDDIQLSADWLLIPAGPFILGSDLIDTEHRAREFGAQRPWYQDEHPRQTMTLPAFAIDRTEVTEADYARFVLALNYPAPPHWVGSPKVTTTPELPMTHVDWMDAQNYCHWRGARLPSEFEWEKAARGVDGNTYPWGNDFDHNRANLGRTGKVSAPGHYDGASPFGAVDMAGNVWEWTASWYQPYPENTQPSPLYGNTRKVLRGGSAGSDGGHYILEELTSRSAYRFPIDPRTKVEDIGFRCAQGLDKQGNPLPDNQARLHG